MKKTILVGFMSMGLIIGGAVGINSVQQSFAKDDDSAVKVGQDILDIKKVKTIALSAVKGGKIKSIELDDDHHYEIEIHNGTKDYDVYVDAYTGEVLKVKEDHRHDDDDDDKREFKNSKGSIISKKKAKQIAEKHVNGKMKEIELDKDDGQWIYEIELISSRGEVDLELDAKTGKVIKVDYDHDDDDNDDNDFED